MPSRSRDATLTPYSPKQVLVASLLGSIPAGVFLCAGNFKALGRAGYAVGILVAGLLVTTALVFLAFILPANVPGYALSFLAAYLVYRIAHGLFGGAVDRHVAAGGKVAPVWKVIVACLLGAGVTYALYFGIGRYLFEVL